MANLHGFELIRQDVIDELNCEARLYRHVRSGAELLSMINDDENKVFGITFRTPPNDSTGVAHIMEHSVLGGSRKYQVKEPFVELLKGSLNTFLNAFTASDWTTYPVASTNLQDFYNLVEVYLDAVFYPLLTTYHLDQEGWHLELARPEDPLTFKGVVYNEMKGAYSSPDNLFYRHNQRSLFKGHIYGFDSGGDPREIPNLTHEQFKAFHDAYYHPVNARIYFYGDDDPEERLRILDAYLRDYEVIAVNSAVPLAERYSAPRYFRFPYSVNGEGEEELKGRVQLNWLLPENNDPNLTMELSVLSYALVSTPASPLRKALIDSGLGEELTGGGLSADLRELTFGVGLKGINPADADQVEELILTTLEQLAAEGFEPEMIEAALNTIEFQLRENNTGSFPRGLGLMLRAISTWMYDGNPLAMVAYEQPLQATKERLAADPGYLQGLIRTYLLDNPHRTTVLLEPDVTYAERLEQEEKERLAAIRAGLAEPEIQAIIANSQTLKARQEAPDSPENLAAIPTLTLADLDPESKELPIEIEKSEGTEILVHDLFTNGIIYLDAGFNLQRLPAELLPYVNLFGTALTDLGTEDEDYVKLSQRIDRKTGGIRHATMISSLATGDGIATWLMLRGKATTAQGEELLAIFRDVLLGVKLDNKERFRQIVLEAKAGEEAGLIGAGHVVARSRLAAHLTLADWVSEQISGVDYLFFLNQLLKEIEADWPTVLAKLEAIRAALVDRPSMMVNVTLDAENYQHFRSQLMSFLETLPAGSGSAAAWTPELRPINEGLTIPARVNYVAKGANLYALGYQLHGSIAVISKYLRTSWLWEKVRVQGGAYGGSCSFNQFSGVFSFSSYRDPNLMGTLTNYDGTADFLRRLSLSKEELTKAIIGTIGDVDSYQLPDAKGYTSMVRHLLGVTQAHRQQYRDEILGTAVADFNGFGDVLAQVNDAGLVVVLGSAEAISAANENGWLQVKKVL